MAFQLPVMTKQEVREEMTKTTFRMPKTLLKEVQIFGVQNDMTDQEIFNQALREWMTRETAKEAKKK
jgi:hypothetical protein